MAGVALWQFFGNANQGYIDTHSLFYWWVFQWFNPASETQHGPLILALSGWVLWRNLARSNESAPGGNFSRGVFLGAVGLLFAGLALHFLGYRAQQARVSIVAWLIFASGLFRIAGGRRWGRASFFPLAFLLFAIPFDALDSAGFWLRLWVIRASAAIAHVAHLEVLQNGTQLAAPDGKFNYDVAAACSGVRSLVALLALSLLIGYLNFRSNYLRALVVFISLPLVYLGNVARIVSIIFAGAWGGQRWGERLHDIMGYGVFLIVLGGVLLFVRILSKRVPSLAAARRWGGASPHHLSSKPRYSLASTILLPAFICLVVVAESFALSARSSRGAQGLAGIRLAADEVNPLDLPQFLGIDWTGKPESVTAAEREILPPDTGYSRRLYYNHHDPSRQVFFSVVLSGRDRSSIHRPELCLIGQGWTILDSSTARFAEGEIGGGSFTATLLRVEHELPGPKPRRHGLQLVAYWFVGPDEIAGGYWARLAYDAWNRVAHGRADRWAYILVQTNADDGEAAALSRLRAVVAQVLPEVLRRKAASLGR